MEVELKVGARFICQCRWELKCTQVELVLRGCCNDVQLLVEVKMCLLQVESGCVESDSESKLN